MKYAIYFVVVGEEALHCLNYAYKTLRNAGFSNDVYIITDTHNINFEISSRTFIKNIREGDLNLDINYKGPLKSCDVRRFDLRGVVKSKHKSVYKWAIANVRTMVDSYIPINDYEGVLYLDVDVLAEHKRKKFEKFLGKYRNFIIVSASSDSLRLGGRGNFSLRKLRRVKTTEAGNLTFLELLRYWFVKPICSDIVYFPVNKIGLKFVKTWREECKKGIYQDQSALQAILLRYFRRQFLLAPHSVFGHGVKLGIYKETGETGSRVDSTFVHFQGALKDPIVLNSYYNKYLKK